MKSASRSTRCAGIGADILLGNTYHLMLRPTAERVKRLGELHLVHARWTEGPILTDSGGFQVMSLSEDLQGYRGRRRVSKPPRWLETFPVAGALHRDPGRPAGLRYRHATGRMRRLRPAEAARAALDAMRTVRRGGPGGCKTAFGTRDAQALFGIRGRELDLRGPCAGNPPSG